MNKKSTIDDIDSDYIIKQVLKAESAPILFITKGRVRVDIQEDGARILGKEQDVKIIKEYIEAKEFKDKNVPKLLKHFGWEVIDNKDDGSISGEGVAAFVLMQILSGNITDQETIEQFFDQVKLFQMPKNS